MMINQWRRHYLFISDFIALINRSFGFFLLIITTAAFVGMINSSFNVLTAPANNRWVTTSHTLDRILFILFFAKPLVYVVVAAREAHKIREEVHCKQTRNNT